MNKKEKTIEEPGAQPEMAPRDASDKPLDAVAEEAGAQPAEGAAAPSAQTEQAQQQLLRLQADFDNFRKRVTRERADWFQRANEDLMLELLPVVDHFEMGLNTARDHQIDPAVQEGFNLVYDQLLSVLAKFNLQSMDAVGQAFDPHRHEAVTHLPSDSVEEGHVTNQLRRGYLLGDKLLRPAQVVVSSGRASDQV
ncbi:MAG: nucleotide exchange factor GrpE [Kiritimatiellae bacterium]|nr:nucleotide exchange factor GrpE [Kiritimatiellia bacterium]